MPDRDLNTQRLFESALYGTPSYHGVRTPDGRVLSELHQLRLDEERRGTQLVRIQEDLVEGLRAANQGSTAISRQDFSARQAELLPVFREAASRIGGLYQTQAELLHESRTLGRITASGFTAVEAGLSDVRSELRGVRGDIVDMDSHITGAIEEGTRTLQGPSLPLESMSSLVARSQTFFDALSAYSKGILTQEAEYELCKLIDSRLGSAKAKAALRSYVDQKAEETVKRLREDDPDEDEKKWRDLKNELRRKGYELSGIIDRPSSLIYCYGTNEARDDLRRLEQISRQFPDEALRQFVHEALGLVSMSKKATHAPVPESFLVELTNSGLVVDGVQHQVKQRNRGARRAGTAVDRNYNLMELLEQGDHAAAQRARFTEIAEKQLGVSTEALSIDRAALGQREELVKVGNAQVLVGMAGVIQGEKARIQRETLIRQGKERAEDEAKLFKVGSTLVGKFSHVERGIEGLDQNLVRIVEHLSTGNDHLVNLETIGRSFVEVAEAGFKAVTATIAIGLQGHFERLESIAWEIAESRSKLVEQLEQIEMSIKEVGFNLTEEIRRGNSLLEQLINLHKNSLKNLAVQRARQGLKFLSLAEKPDDFREAASIFLKGVQEDPTLIDNQLGLALAYEGSEDNSEAKKRYQIVCKLASDDTDLYIFSSVRLSQIEEKEGNMPEAIKYIRLACERDQRKLELQKLLVRLLRLAGFTTEANEREENYQTEHSLSGKTIKAEEKLVVTKGLYYINEDISVEEGGELVIEAGTILEFGKGVGLLCRGRLLIKGTKEANVYLRPIDKFWGNLTLVGTNITGSKLEHCTFEGGTGRIYSPSDPTSLRSCPSPSKQVKPKEQTCGGSVMIIHSNSEISDHKVVTLNNVRIKQSASTWGGGLYAESTSVIIEDSSFEENSAGSRDDELEFGLLGEGGGVYFKDCTLSLKTTVVRKNYARNKGGGVLALGCQIDINSCAVTENTTYVCGDGGGAYILKSSGEIASSEFEKNGTYIDPSCLRKSGIGGALFIIASNLEISDTRLTRNRSNVAAAFLCMGSTLSLKRCTVNENGADAAIIWVDGGQLTITNSEIKSNYFNRKDFGLILASSFKEVRLVKTTLPGGKDQIRLKK